MRRKKAKKSEFPTMEEARAQAEAAIQGLKCLKCLVDLILLPTLNPARQYEFICPTHGAAFSLPKTQALRE